MDEANTRLSFASTYTPARRLSEQGIYYQLFVVGNKIIRAFNSVDNAKLSSRGKFHALIFSSARE